MEKLQLHAFGRGEERETYLNRVTERRLPVLFHSPVPGISRLFPAFDAVVMPSRFEGLARVAVESLAAGVPIIATSAPGLREALPPRWPLTVPVEDHNALGNVIADFVDGAFDEETLSEGAARWGQNFTADKMIEAYETAYRDFLSFERTPRRERNMTR